MWIRHCHCELRLCARTYRGDLHSPKRASICQDMQDSAREAQEADRKRQPVQRPTYVDWLLADRSLEKPLKGGEMVSLQE